MNGGYTFDFRCVRDVHEMQSVWNSIGPFEWKAFGLR